MSKSRIESALTRIEAAMTRIDGALPRAGGQGVESGGALDPALAQAHERLRGEVARTIAEIDGLIAKLQP